MQKREHLSAGSGYVSTHGQRQIRAARRSSNRVNAGAALGMRPEMIGPEQQAYQYPQGRDDNCQSFLRVFCHVKRAPL